MISTTSVMIVAMICCLPKPPLGGASASGAESSGSPAGASSAWGRHGILSGLHACRTSARLPALTAKG